MAHFEPFDPIEESIRAKLNDLLAIRRQYMKATADRDEHRAAGNKIFDELTEEIRASVKPPKPAKRAKQTKTKAGKD
jgi:hypothetical protein